MSLKLQDNCGLFARAGGFTLIGTAIAMLVLSLILIPFIQIQRIQREDTAALAEIGYATKAADALKLYAIEHGNYPAPADPTLDFNSTDTTVLGNAGLQTTTSGMACPGVSQNVVCSKSTGAGVLIGTLPFTVLGLPLSSALDQYGHKYLYAVTQSLTAANSLVDYGAVKIVRQDNATDYDSGSSSSKAQFVVLSSGENGNGAYRSNGTRIACPATPAIENQNCNDDGTFLKLYNAGKSSPEDGFNRNRLAGTRWYFDDSLKYESTAFAKMWTTKKSDDAFMTSNSGQANVVIGKTKVTNAHNSPVIGAALEVGTTTGGAAQNAKADNVMTQRLCDTQAAATSSSCVTLDSLTNPSDTSLKCGHYTISAIVADPTNGKSVKGGGYSSCDTAPIMPLSPYIPNLCPLGAKGLDSSGNLVCF